MSVSAPAPGSSTGMFLFFSNRGGCLPSLLISIVGTLFLLVLMDVV